MRAIIRSAVLCGAAALSMTLASCATVVGGTSQDMLVETDPAGARCELRRAGQSVGSITQTPGTITVSRRKEAIEIACVRDGHQDTVEVVESHFGGATVGNVLLGGLIGIAVDAASGANNVYPERVEIVMTPSSFPGEAARDAYFAKVAADITARTAAEAKQIMDRCNASQRELCQIDVKRRDESRDATLKSLDQKRLSARIDAPATAAPPARR